MIFESLETGPLFVNCYILGDERTRYAAVVDPGGNVDEILMLLVRHRLATTHILQTHCHFDHLSGVVRLARVVDAPVYIHRASAQLAGRIGLSLSQPPPVGGYFAEGESVAIGDVRIIPLHSPGSVCFTIAGEDRVITGDVLFQMSIGRTDVPGGSLDVLLHSIRTKLFPLGDQCVVHPGHGPSTTIGHERRYNPFLQMSHALH